MIGGDKLTTILKGSFTGSFVNGNDCAISERLNHLALRIVYRLTLRGGAVDHPPTLKGELASTFGLLPMPTEGQCKAQCSVRETRLLLDSTAVFGGKSDLSFHIIVVSLGSPRRQPRGCLWLLIDSYLIHVDFAILSMAEQAVHLCAFGELITPMWQGLIFRLKFEAFREEGYFMDRVAVVDVADAEAWLIGAYRHALSFVQR
nr:MAG TPA: hypothetical protein [Caudoviricetes sp.]